MTRTEALEDSLRRMLIWHLIYHGADPCDLCSEAQAALDAAPREEPVGAQITEETGQERIDAVIVAHRQGLEDGHAKGYAEGEAAGFRRGVEVGRREGIEEVAKMFMGSGFAERHMLARMVRSLLPAPSAPVAPDPRCTCGLGAPYQTTITVEHRRECAANKPAAPPTEKEKP